MITASALTRLRRCPSSAVLPRAENHSRYADEGHDEHEDLARQTMAGTLPDELARLVPSRPRVEVKVAYDVAARTGRIIGEGGTSRDYGSPGPFEIVGSFDVGGAESDLAIVVDWKTGYADVEPAATNDQLWFYALALCRALGLDAATIRIVYTKTGRVDEHHIDALDLAEFAGQLERLHVEIAERHAAAKRGEMLETREGSWCKHCASKHACPSKNALLVQVASQGLAVIGDTTMTPERAVSAYEQVAKVEQLVKEAKKRLETYVDEQGPIDLGSGRLYGRYHRKGNEKLDGDIAIRAIREVVPEQAKEFESIAIEHKATKSGIDRAAKQLFAAGATKTAKAVVARVRELGGSKSDDTYPIGEFMADKHTPARAPEVEVGDINRLLAEAG